MKAMGLVTEKEMMKAMGLVTGLVTEKEMMKAMGLVTASVTGLEMATALAMAPGTHRRRAGQPLPNLQLWSTTLSSSTSGILPSTPQ